MPIWSHWWVRLQIDDGTILHGTHIYFHSSNSPTVERFYPQAASPARNINDGDFENSFWTEWYDLDDDKDRI